MKKMLIVFAALVFLAGCGNNQKTNDAGNTANVEQPSDNAVTYDCDGEIVKVDFENETDPKAAKLFFVDKEVSITLPEVMAGSGARYSDDDVTFWIHKKEATLTSEASKVTLKCEEKNTDDTIEGNIVDENGNTVPAGCKMWFDGCNNCQVMENGMLACTRKACDEAMMQKPRCLDDEQQVDATNPQQKCAEAGGVWSVEHNSCFEDPSTMAGPGEK